MSSSKVTKRKNKEAQNPQDSKNNSNESTTQNIKYGPMPRFPGQRVWSRGILILGVLLYVWYTSKDTKETLLAKQNEIHQRRSQNIECSTDFLEEIRQYPGCVPKKCGRFVSDKVITSNEADALLRLAQRGLALGGSDGGASILDLHSGALSYKDKFINIYSVETKKKFITATDISIYKIARSKIQHAIAEQFNIDENSLYLTHPTFFSRLTNVEPKTPHDEYWHTHIDKVTYESFHYTSLIYLNDYGVDFTGGRFNFIDNVSNKTIIVEPRKGRLSAFTSGAENPHFVERVKTGTSTMLPKDDYSKYIEERNKLLATESRQFIGGHLNLSDHELKVNQIILNEKHKEFDSTPFLPSRHFFNAKSNIEQSVIFSMLKKLPKGASLHTHLLAGVSVDYIIENITYLPNIYGCYLNNVFKMKFFQNVEANSDWKPLSMYRQNDSNFDSFLRRQISLVRDNSWDSSAAVWEQFKKSFSTCYDMLCHQPVFEDYVYQLLKELYDDNVFYTELKGTFMPLYDLNGTVYDVKHFFQTFINIVNKFKMERPDFVGVRYIHSIYRGVNDDVLKQGLQQLIEMQELFPAFIAGFDFVGYEEEGNSISDYSETLLNYSEQLKYFFHAGETNWFGHTDLNLLDAVLLNCTRIGHGFALAKHPVLMELVKEKKIALEICPISNQVLMLNSDPRNHPAASLMANGVPVVVCNDDPALWGASGLSYDWYVAFMAMTPRGSGIEVLKQFAFNSIQFSCMQNEEKKKALTLWNLKWNEFLDSFKNEIKPV